MRIRSLKPDFAALGQIRVADGDLPGAQSKVGKSGHVGAVQHGGVRVIAALKTIRFHPKMLSNDADLTAKRKRAKALSNIGSFSHDGQPH